MDDGSLKEIKSASGGTWGGVGINDEFFKFMGKVFGREIFHTFKKEHMNQYFELERKFESEKRRMKWGERSSIIIPLPSALLRKYQERVQRPPSAKFEQTKFADQAEIIEDQLEIKSTLIESFFEKTVASIVKHVKDIFEEPKVKAMNIKNILMVGGFAESEFVQGRITKEFGRKTVMVPHEAGSAVLKGAVLFGHNPEIISARICPYTYGLHTRKPYDPKRHGDEKRVIFTGSKKVVDNVFDKHLEIGETVYIAEELKMHNFYTIDKDKMDVFWNVFKSTNKDPIFCDDPDCDYIGKLRVSLKGAGTPGKRRELGVRIVCRGTELEAIVIDKDTKVSHVARFDFLK